MPNRSSARISSKIRSTEARTVRDASRRDESTSVTIGAAAFKALEQKLHTTARQDMGQTTFKK